MPRRRVERCIWSRICERLKLITIGIGVAPVVLPWIVHCFQQPDWPILESHGGRGGGAVHLDKAIIPEIFVVLFFHRDPRAISGEVNSARSMRVWVAYTEC